MAINAPAETMTPLHGPERIVLGNDVTVDLRAMYAPSTEGSPHLHFMELKHGNVTYVKHKSPKKEVVGFININVQKQMEAASLTYKPFNTHISIANVTSHESGGSACKYIADKICRRRHSYFLKAWDPHSVLVGGDFLQKIQYVVEKCVCKWDDLALEEDIHVELFPVLRPGEWYVSLDALAWNVKEKCGNGKSDFQDHGPLTTQVFEVLGVDKVQDCFKPKIHSIAKLVSDRVLMLSVGGEEGTAEGRIRSHDQFGLEVVAGTKRHEIFFVHGACGVGKSMCEPLKAQYQQSPSASSASLPEIIHRIITRDQVQALQIQVHVPT